MCQGSGFTRTRGNRSLALSDRRTRPKGDPDPGWQRISWDEALDETATAMRRIAAESGPEAVAFAVTTPSGTAISDAAPWIDRLINAFGSPNNCNATEICAWHRNYARVFTTGTAIGAPDYERAGCILLWGHNPSTSSRRRNQGGGCQGDCMRSSRTNGYRSPHRVEACGRALT